MNRWQERASENLLPEGMVRIEATLNPGSDADTRLVQWAARAIDRQVRRVRPIHRWVVWLEALPRQSPEGSSDHQTMTSTRLRAQILRAVFGLGAERAVYEGVVSRAELHQLVLDPYALRLLVDLKTCEDRRVLTAVQNAMDAVELVSDISTVRDGSIGDQFTPIVVGSPETDRDQSTDLATSTSDEALEELHARVAKALFPLLDEIGIKMDAQSEAAKGTELLRYLVGDEAVKRFADLYESLDNLRDDSGRAAMMIRGLAPELFAKAATGNFRYRLSYRLFLRTRLRSFCNKEGWQPVPSRFKSLNAAIAHLTRDRIGEIMDSALAQIQQLDQEAKGRLEQCGVPQDNLQTVKALTNRG